MLSDIPRTVNIGHGQMVEYSPDAMAKLVFPELGDLQIGSSELRREDVMRLVRRLFRSGQVRFTHPALRPRPVFAVSDPFGATAHMSG